MLCTPVHFFFGLMSVTFSTLNPTKQITKQKSMSYNFPFLVQLLFINFFLNHHMDYFPELTTFWLHFPKFLSVRSYLHPTTDFITYNNPLWRPELFQNAMLISLILVIFQKSVYRNFILTFTLNEILERINWVNKGILIILSIYVQSALKRLSSHTFSLV